MGFSHVNFRRCLQVEERQWRRCSNRHSEGRSTLSPRRRRADLLSSPEDAQLEEEGSHIKEDAWDEEWTSSPGPACPAWLRCDVCFRNAVSFSACPYHALSFDKYASGGHRNLPHHFTPHAFATS